MKTMRRMLVLGCVLVLAFALAACGQGGVSGQASTNGAFKGFGGRSIDDLANAANAAMEEAAAIDKKDVDSQQEAKAATEFPRANTMYRAMNYAEATKKYQEALDYNPKHHGANVNLTLSLLQEGRAEEALAQALKCVALFPDDAGCLLNAQAAGTACEFLTDDLDMWLDLIVSDRGNTSVSAVLTPSSKPAVGATYNDAYMYNAIWNRIETELYQGEKTAQNAVEIAPVDAYLEMKESLIGLNPDDADVAGLQAYLEAVAQQLGLNKEQ